MTTLSPPIDGVPAGDRGPTASGPPAVAVPAKTWIAVIGATLGAFMAVLNIQIVNASLFMVFSAACALAQNLPQMIVLRAVQGFSGGVLIPMAFTLIITLLPKAKQPIGLAMFAISATFAPAIGLTIGGSLTENWGWEYIFYVNLVPGALMIGMLWFSLEAKPMKLPLLREGDWLGIITMAIGLSALQTVLEEGNKDDWFGSPFIVRLSIVAAVALSTFLWIELTVKKPLLNLRLLVRRNFGFGILANFLLGIALFAGSNFMNIHMTNDYATDQLLWPNIVRAFGQALVFAPLSAVATAGIEAENAGSASGLFNMMRNLGGAVGIALLQTLLT